MENIKYQMEKMQLYTARVDRTHPSFFLFLIDQSGSMDNWVDFGNERIAKSEAVANAINSTLEEIINRCTKSNEIRRYFDISLIGYGQNDYKATLLYPNKEWLSPEELKDRVKIKKVTSVFSIRGTEHTIEKNVPYWLEPVAEGLTPMHDAFNRAYDLLEKWCENHKGDDCFPPIVINITDGEQTDASNEEMIEVADKIKSLQTIDGNVLLFNIHLSDSDEKQSIAFPAELSEVGDSSYSQMLFAMSSELPAIFNKQIEVLTKKKQPSYRAMGLNTKAEFVHILNIGTQTTMSADDE